MKKVDDLISIIIPVYNAEKYLNDTINTVLNQTYTNWELILVDDCSKDNSVEIINNYIDKDKRIELVKLGKNSGQANARNIGIDNAKGNFICFLDADDLWDKDKLDKQINFMKEKDIAFSYHSYEFADESGKPSGKKVIAKEKLTYHKALKNTIISTITVMFNINKIDKDLIKMQNLKYVEDTATWWKILRSGYNAYGISDIFSYYRRIPNSSSHNKLKTQKYLWNLYLNVEKLNPIYALYCLFWKNVHAVMRRI